MYDLIRFAEKLNARVIVVAINNIEKVIYRDGKIYILQDGNGIVKRRLYPREIAIIKEKLRNGDYYYR